MTKDRLFEMDAFVDALVDTLVDALVDPSAFFMRTANFDART